MKALFLTFLFSLPAAAAAGPLNMIPCSIYGTDDRVDLYQAEARMRAMAGSTAAMFKDSEIPLDEATGSYTLRRLSLREKNNLRGTARFGEQTVGAYCSAVLVGDDLMLTAGHCFKPDRRGGPCERVKFVFGYAMTSSTATPGTFPASDVYSCKSIVKQRVRDDVSNFSCSGGTCTEAALNGLGPDWALVKLDRKVKGRVPLAISRGAVSTSAKLTAIGYPSGLPVKVSPNGSVRSISSANGYFVTDLDTFAGSSGGPVINSETYRIEGILVRGGVDYIYGTGTPVEDPRNPYMYDPGEANVYPQNGGRGEDVTLSSEFQSLIPKGEFERSLEEYERQRNSAPARPRAVPAIYMPGSGGSGVVPAIYVPPPTVSEPRVLSI